MEQLAGLPRDTLGALGKAYVADLPQRSPIQAHVTDKMPRNFLYIGLIRQILPNAKIIHTRRNPLDTCLSCFSQLFDGDFPYLYDLAELGRYWKAYDRLMQHWRSILPPAVYLEVQYEDVVADPEVQSRRLVAHCGLPWDPACLDSHTNQRAVRTASAAQVRRSIYRDAVDRAAAYGALLDPLRRALQAT